MEEVIKVPIGEDIAKMSSEELYKFIMEEDGKLRRHSADVCRGQGLLEFQKGNVEKQMAAKYGMAEYHGVYVKVMILKHIPQVFRDAIDSKGGEVKKEDPITEQENAT